MTFIGPLPEGRVYAAPAGTPIPTDLKLPPGWADLGWIETAPRVSIDREDRDLFDDEVTTVRRTNLTVEAHPALAEALDGAEASMLIEYRVKLPEPPLTIAPSWLDWVIPGRRKRREAEQRAHDAWKRNPYGARRIHLPRVTVRPS